MIDSLDALTPELQEKLSSILERYMADLEQGVRGDPKSLIALHPELAGPLNRYLSSLDFLHRAAGDLGPSSATTEAAPKQLGDFEIVREVGRGGMGVVYEAKEASLGRRVALKVLPFAAVLDSRQIARFKNEAQAAAQLHHPHIVPVYSVGCDRGVHYYAMQFIEGQSLDHVIAELRSHDALDEADRKSQPNPAGQGVSTINLGYFSTQRSANSRNHVRAVIALMVQAAEALQHAHEFGVVHRDIKPSNLMLDHQGELWVTDFGLARCQTSTQVTMTGDLLGTVRYMSPEQAAGRGYLVDHLSDLYSLGVTLYELLTLSPPHAESDREGLLQAIQHQPPPSPQSLNPSIPVDLDTILLKMLSKERDERYASAQAVADDLNRFLSGKPPLAKRPTLLDRTAKWASRHRRLVASVVGAMFLAIVATASAAMLLAKEQRNTELALASAEANFHQSQKNLGKAIEVVDRFGMRIANRLAGIPGAESIRRLILEETLADYEAFAKQMQGDPSMRFALALCRTQMASMNRGLGRLPESTHQYEQAIVLYDALLSELPSELLSELLRELPTKFDSDPNATPSATNPIVDHARILHDIAVSHNNLGELFFQQGNVEKADAHYEEALQHAKRIVKTNSDDTTHQHVLSAILVNDGNLKRATGQTALARAAYARAVKIQRSLCEQNPESSPLQRELAVSYAQLSFLNAADNLGAADQFNQQAIEIHQRLLKKAPDDLVGLSELATCYNHRGGIFRQRKRIDESRNAYREAIEIQSSLVSRAPHAVRYREQLAVGCNNMAQMLISESGKAAEAQSYLERAKDLLTELVATSPESPHYRSQLGGVLANLAPMFETSQSEVAREYYRDAITHQRWALERSPSIAEFRLWLSSSYVKFARFLRQQGDCEEAGELALTRRKLWEGVPQRLYLISIELAKTAAACEQTGLPEQRWIDEAIATLDQAKQSGFDFEKSQQLDPAFDILKNEPNYSRVTQP